MTGYNHYPDCTCGWCIGGYRGGGGGRASYIASAMTLYGDFFPGINLRAYDSYTIPNASCPVCGASVFFHQARNGGRVFFDELGPPWPKHPCTDNSFSSSLKSPPSKKEGNVGTFGHILSQALVKQETAAPASVINNNTTSSAFKDKRYPQWVRDDWEPVYVDHVKEHDGGSEVTFIKVKDNSQIRLSFDGCFTQNSNLPIFLKRRGERGIFDVSRLHEDATFEDLIGYTHHVYNLSGYDTHPLVWCERGGWDPIRVISITAIAEDQGQQIMCVSVQKIESGQEITLRMEKEFVFDNQKPLFMREQETIDIYDIANLANIIRDANGGETNFFVGHAYGPPTRDPNR